MGSDTNAIIDETLSGLLLGRMPEERARLLEAVAKGVRLRAWIRDATLPEEVRDHLRDARADVGLAVFDLLCDWHEIGGRVGLDGPESDPDDRSSDTDPVDPSGIEESVEPGPSPQPLEAVPDMASTTIVEPVSVPPATAALPVRPVVAKPAWVPVPSNSDALRALVRDLSAQRTPEEEIAFLRELARSSARLDRIFPVGARTDALSFLVARARHLREEGRLQEEILLLILSSVVSYARHADVGAVYGPSRSHVPRGGSWASDAGILLARVAKEAGVDIAPPNPEKLLAQLEKLVSTGGGETEILGLANQCLDARVASRDPRLVRILRPVLHALDGKRFKDVRAEIRDRIAEESDAEDALPEAVIPESWPFRHLTSGKRAVMVGGDRRETNRRRIQERFGFSSLEWAKTEFKKRELLALRDRIKRGGADMIILLTAFAGHDADDIVQPACQASGVTFVPVHTGYGIVGIRSAIERHGPR